MGELTSNKSFSPKEGKLLKARLLRFTQSDCIEKYPALYCKWSKSQFLEIINYVLTTSAIERVKRIWSTPYLTLFVIKLCKWYVDFANHGRNLLIDVDSNVVEHYNTKVKRVKFGLKKSYASRCIHTLKNVLFQVRHTVK